MTRDVSGRSDTPFDVAVVYDPQLERWELAINGLQGSTIPVGDGPLMVGRGRDGNIVEVIIDTAVPPSEAIALVRQTFGPAAAGVLGVASGAGEEVGAVSVVVDGYRRRDDLEIRRGTPAVTADRRYVVDLTDGRRLDMETDHGVLRFSVPAKKRSRRDEWVRVESPSGSLLALGRLCADAERRDLRRSEVAFGLAVPPERLLVTVTRAPLVTVGPEDPHGIAALLRRWWLWVLLLVAVIAGVVLGMALRGSDSTTSMQARPLEAPAITTPAVQPSMSTPATTFAPPTPPATTVNWVEASGAVTFNGVPQPGMTVFVVKLLYPEEGAPFFGYRMIDINGAENTAPWPDPSLVTVTTNSSGEFDFTFTDQLGGGVYLFYTTFEGGLSWVSQDPIVVNGPDTPVTANITATGSNNTTNVASGASTAPSPTTDPSNAPPAATPPVRAPEAEETVTLTPYGNPTSTQISLAFDGAVTSLQPGTVFPVLMDLTTSVPWEYGVPPGTVITDANVVAIEREARGNCVFNNGVPITNTTLQPPVVEIRIRNTVGAVVPFNNLAVSFRPMIATVVAEECRTAPFRRDMGRITANTNVVWTRQRIEIRLPDDLPSGTWELQPIVSGSPLTSVDPLELTVSTR